MEELGFNNLLSITIGVLTIITCFLTAYLFQKYFFSRYKDKVRNTINKDKKSDT